ncbi:MAG: hypothetical protein QXR30_03730 [Candidatus Woesearchaeota archaeon]
MSSIERYLKNKPENYLKSIVDDLLAFEEDGILPRTSTADEVLRNVFGKTYETNRVQFLNMLAKETFKLVTKKYFGLL